MSSSNNKNTGRKACLLVAARNSGGADQADFVCDGIDDQAEIQAAIAALPAGGGAVRLFEGLYNVSMPIVLKSRTVLAAVDRNRPPVLFLQAAHHSALETNAAAGAFELVVKTADGFKPETEIVVISRNEFRFAAKIKNIRNNTLALYEAIPAGLNIDRAEIWSLVDVIHVNNVSDVSVDSVAIDGHADHQVVFKQDDSYLYDTSGKAFHATDGNKAILIGEGSENIKNNSISNCNGGIVIAFPNEKVSTGGSVISENIITDNKLHGIMCCGARFCSIRGNIIKRNNKYGLIITDRAYDDVEPSEERWPDHPIRGSGPACDILVAENIFEDNASLCAPPEDIHVQGASNIEVLKNLFRSSR